MRRTKKITEQNQSSEEIAASPVLGFRELVDNIFTIGRRKFFIDATQREPLARPFRFLQTFLDKNFSGA
jgi:hypothetical protein